MALFYPLLQWIWKGGILVSPCPSVRLSLCGQNHVRSVSSTKIIGFISYLHILLSNFRRCVTCIVCLKMRKFSEFFKFVTLTLSYFVCWIQYDSIVWVIMRRQGYPQNACIPFVVLVWNNCNDCNIVAACMTDANAQRYQQLSLWLSVIDRGMKCFCIHTLWPWA